MSILGMGSAWWSLTGLIVDIAGFSVLTWDLLPEYRLNRAWQYLRAADREADEFEERDLEGLSLAASAAAAADAEGENFGC